MADRYRHYGVEVLRQYCNGFKEYIKKKQIKYTELAIRPELDVIVYNTEKGRRYAYIRQLFLPDEYSELVYITEQTPDDYDWEKLAKDIDAQCGGAEAMVRRTRAKMLLDAAMEIYYQNLPNLVTENIFVTKHIPHDEKDMFDAIATILAGWGIDREELQQMEHDDIDTEFWDSL